VNLTARPHGKSERGTSIQRRSVSRNRIRSSQRRNRAFIVKGKAEPIRGGRSAPRKARRRGRYRRSAALTAAMRIGHHPQKRSSAHARGGRSDRGSGGLGDRQERLSRHCATQRQGSTSARDCEAYTASTRTAVSARAAPGIHELRPC
jgi:hypothetical protein